MNFSREYVINLIMVMLRAIIGIALSLNLKKKPCIRYVTYRRLNSHSCVVKIRVYIYQKIHIGGLLKTFYAIHLSGKYMIQPPTKCFE